MFADCVLRRTYFNISGIELQFGSYNWCPSRNRSITVFTGLNVSIGTSTNTVFQSAIAPFHSPGRSRAFRAIPFLDFSDINQV